MHTRGNEPLRNCLSSSQAEEEGGYWVKATGLFFLNRQEDIEDILVDEYLEEVQEELKISKSICNNLAWMNDQDDKDFKEIADWVERNIPGD